MATRYFLRGSHGRFAGSTGGGGGRGGGLPVGTRRGGALTKSTGAGGGYTKAVGLGRRGVTGKKVYTRGEVFRSPAGHTVGARRYVSQGRRASRDALVMQVHNGRVTSTPPANSRIVRRAVSGGTRTKVGSPVGGNSNVRYVSRLNAATRGVTYTNPIYRGVGRATSARGARAINSGRSSSVRHGYVVMYGPRRAVA